MFWKVQYATNQTWERIEAAEARVTDCGALVFGAFKGSMGKDDRLVAAFAPGNWIRFERIEEKEE